MALLQSRFKSSELWLWLCCIKGNARQSIFEVDAGFAKSKMEELEKQYNKKNLFISNIAKLLLSKRNIILQGAPGTGKTYNTAAIALKALGITDTDLTDHTASWNAIILCLETKSFLPHFISLSIMKILLKD